MPILNSPKYKIVGIKKKDCAFVRNYKVEIGDIIQFSHDPCSYMPEVTINFINNGRSCRRINSVNLRSFDSFIETEIVDDTESRPETQTENFEL